MISNGTFNAEWLSHQFKVMNWNIFADIYATDSMYPYCEKWALAWSWRKELILMELKSGADIITLQEVQQDVYDDWLRPELLKNGYEGSYQQQTREPIFHEGKYTTEGCATFWKTFRFRSMEKRVVELDKEAAKELRKAAQDPEKSIKRVSKGNMALAVILEDLQMEGGRSRRRMLCVTSAI